VLKQAGALRVSVANTPAHRTLAAQKVRELQQLYNQGATRGELTKKFGFSRSQVGNILSRRNWKDVK
jgi:DNA-binding transcriptional regulator LsrR (DeoR family)